MGCGKSKHDVVTGNTTAVKKPSEAESVKGKESDTITRQDICRCRKTDIPAAVSSGKPETTVENNTETSEEEKTGGDCGEKPAEKTNDDKRTEERESTSPPATTIVPENIVAEETVNDEKKSVLPVDEPNEKVDIETVVEEEKNIEEKINNDVNTEILTPEVEEPKSDVQMELEDQEILSTENVEVAPMENNDITVLKDEQKSKVIEA